jgi:REP element-mobilizing transposase RayT
MTRFNPEIHHRRSIRLQNYDYSQNGAYFVTICVNKKQELLGNIENGEMIPNDAGLMVSNLWQKLAEKFDGVFIDEFCVMPNHFHGILVIENSMKMGENMVSPVRIEIENTKNVGVEPCFNPIQGLPRFISWFKRISTNKYIHGVNKNGWEPFYQKLWLRNYHERVIRNESDLEKIRQYIVNNPANWENDENYLSDNVDLGENTVSPVRIENKENVGVEPRYVRVEPCFNPETGKLK